jgi:hypothetical protein
LRIKRPDIGYQNMRKLTPGEAKIIGLGKQLVNKLRIMMNDDGKPSFWLQKNKSNDVTPFSGTDDEYFDNDRASQRLEQFWAEHGL